MYDSEKLSIALIQLVLLPFFLFGVNYISLHTIAKTNISNQINIK